MAPDNDTDDPQQQSFSTGRVIVALLLIVGYPLSVGPFMWLYSRDIVPMIVAIIYQPLFWVIAICPDSVQAIFHWYIGWWNG